MEPKERLMDLIMYLHLNDEEFYKMYGIPREKLFEIYRKIPTMDHKQISSMCERLFINEDYIYGRDDSLIPPNRKDVCFKRISNVKCYSAEQNQLANYRVKPFLINAIKTEDDYHKFNGAKSSRIKLYLKNGFMLNDDELEIIMKKLNLNPK